MTRRSTIHWLCAASWAILLSGTSIWANLFILAETPKGWLPPNWWLTAYALLLDVMNPPVLTVVFIIALALTADVVVAEYGPTAALIDDDQHGAQAQRGS